MHKPSISSLSEPPESEKSTGAEVYFTKTPGIGGKLRTDPEDFVVDEISLPITPEPNGRYTIARIQARSWEHNRMMEYIARQLHIPYSAVGFAGTKDKRAVISQQISLDAPLKDVETLRFDDFEVLDAFRSNRWLEIGDLIGNRFEIVVRDTDFNNAEKLKDVVGATADTILKEGGFPNFFGIQRFGAVRITTHTIGKFIARGDMKGAVMAYIANPMEGERDDIFAARKMINDGADFAEVLKEYPDKFELERRMIRHLVERPEDWAGAIRELPKHLQTMFVYAYQSYLFNKILSERIRRGIHIGTPVPGDVIIPCTEKVVPEQKEGIMVNERNAEKIAKRVREGKALVTSIVFGSEPVFAEGEPGEIERKIIADENLKPNNFIVPQIPYLSSKGTRRATMVPLKTLDWKIENTETGPAARFKFDLPKGCYATSLLREFMKAEPSRY